ncbi:MAG: S-methyl-5'-thioadenosine phosphorylase [Candidatus Methylomirabilales bacterium]
MAEPVIGVIGGSGLYEMEGLTDLREERVTTPFGDPSDAYVLGRLDGHPVAFLARHGRGHRLLPSELNFRANIYGFKALGAQWIISAAAVGSMREELRPLDIVIPDQFFDRTKGRVSTFFGDGLVVHVSFADPLCPHLSDLLYDAGTQVKATMHRGGIYLCIEGPQFSTRAESRIYRSWGVDVIGMTNLQEAKLSREAEICYATLALVTDYDVWHEAEEDVTVEKVVAILLKNVATAKAIIKHIVPRIPAERSCVCAQALKDAIITAPQAIPEHAKKKLRLLLGKYLERRSP